MKYIVTLTFPDGGVTSRTCTHWAAFHDGVGVLSLGYRTEGRSMGQSLIGPEEWNETFVLRHLRSYRVTVVPQ